MDKFAKIKKFISHLDTYQGTHIPILLIACAVGIIIFATLSIPIAIWISLSCTILTAVAYVLCVILRSVVSGMLMELESENNRVGEAYRSLYQSQMDAILDPNHSGTQPGAPPGFRRTDIS